MSNLPIRIRFLEEKISEILLLPGSVAEVGVFRGKSAKFLAESLPDRTIHLFDTFTGMPDIITEIDGNHWGVFSRTSLKAVKKLLSGFDNVRLHPGVFPDSAEEISSEEFCLVHIDVDLYKSTFDACEFFYPRMVTDGILVFNDYLAPKCKGATKAINEFFADKPEEIVFQGQERTWLRKSS